ncbi:sulfite exporter TauE/SafE family protein [Chthonobacter albigriseus]|uniref:sulfite exporter TauE/SafE family protein n=1 Tax=Chthonobacter albigriseus TaxID=1683161 RepID=UPI0015EEE154|nr:sulfite exporter TauE/SafE family protein [Chthonobacter albigriseus]
MSDSTAPADLLAAFLALPAEPRMLLAFAVVLVAGCVRGFSGFGAGLVYVPAAAALFGPKVAAATILIFDIPVMIPLTIRLLPKADVREVIPLAIGGAMMTPVGYLTLAHLDPVATRWVVSVLVIAGLAAIAAGVRFPREVGDLTAGGVGAMSGFMNGLAQVGGPPLILFWLSRQKPAVTIRASAVLYFTIGTVVTLATYLWGGLITTRVLLMAAWMAPLYAAGMMLGGLMFGRASEGVYRRVAFGIIAGSVVLGLPVW